MLSGWVQMASEVLSNYTSVVAGVNQTTIPNPSPSLSAPPMSSSVQDTAALLSVILPFTAFLNLPDWIKLAVLGTVIEYSRRWLLSWWDSIKNFFFTNILLDANDQSYQWMMNWVSHQPAFRRVRNLEVSTRLNLTSVYMTGTDEEEEEEEQGRNMKYVPTPFQTYNLWYRRRWVQIVRTRNESSNNYWGGCEDKLHIRILTRNRKLVNALLKEAKREYMKEQESCVCVYVNDSADTWRHVATRPKRPLRSIILENGVKDLVLEDAKDFMSSKTWYADRGIPFRRGYLLYGAPGSGKTSLIQAIAGELGLNVYIISLSRGGLDDAMLARTIGELPPQCIALMEDIDAAFHQGMTRPLDADSSDSSTTTASNPPSGAAPTDATPNKQASAGPAPTAVSRVTLSGLLNALDGVGAQEGRILFATTNRYHALDAALIRPGRFDLHVEFRLASAAQAWTLFMTFYLPFDEHEANLDSGKSSDADVEKDLIDLGPPASATAEKEQPTGPPTPSDSSPPTPSGSPEAKASATPAASVPAYVGQSHKARAPILSRCQYSSLAQRFADAVPPEVFSMAQLQGYLMQYKTRPKEAVSDVGGWVDKERSEKEKRKDTKGIKA